MHIDESSVQPPVEAWERRSCGIFLNLPPDVIEAIDQECGGPSYRAGQKHSGRSGGRAAWVRALIYRQLGLELPPDPHLKRSMQFEERLKQKQLQTSSRPNSIQWARVVERVLQLRSEGMSLREIARVLESEGQTTRRGGKWTAHAVRTILLGESRAYEACSLDHKAG